jgi:hypothetical protein
MRSVLILLAAVLPASAASAMPVSVFLGKAEALQSKGPLALFSGDYKLLVNQVKADAAVLKAERETATAAKRKPAYCPPGAVELSSNDILSAMRAVPAAQRDQMDSRSVLRNLLSRRYPCA